MQAAKARNLVVFIEDCPKQVDGQTCGYWQPINVEIPIVMVPNAMSKEVPFSGRQIGLLRPVAIRLSQNVLQHRLMERQGASQNNVAI
jgi:hypothetical protein